MTFYNLPDTDVTVEYDKDKKILHVGKLPTDYSVVEGQNHEVGSTTHEVWVIFGQVDVQGAQGDDSP